LPAVLEPAGEARWAKLAEVVKARRATEFVVGYPYNMDGSVGFKAKEVDAFVAELRARFGLPVHLVDETLTSYAAEDSIKKKDRRGVRDSGLIDSRAATIILQDFLDQKFPPQSTGQD
jgi:putative Holliday junction resolvase